MDNKRIYQYRFNELLNIIRRYQDHPNVERENEWIIDICGNAFRDYQDAIANYESWGIYTTEKILTGLLESKNIKYNIPRYTELSTSGKKIVKKPFAFVLNEPKGNIAYVIKYKLNTSLTEIRNTYKNYHDIDGVKVYFLQRNYQEMIDLFNEAELKNDTSFIEFYGIKEFFDEQFGETEFPIFMSYVNKFNERARALIGLKIIPMPSTDAVNLFRKKISESLKNADYSTLLPSAISPDQRRIILENYISNSRYTIMTGYADFADSFISSEWYYGIHTVNGALEQTGLVAGYLKSVEQLLYSLIRISINTNRHIKKKSSQQVILFDEANEADADTTLGSLIHFIKSKDNTGRFENADIFDVDSNTIQIVIDKLYEYKDYDRNGFLHKDNLYSSEEIQKIREGATVLYCLLAGSFHINDSEYIKLMANDTIDLSSLIIKEDELYEIITNWATPILLFDMPKETHTLAFRVFEYPKNKWTLNLQGLSKIPIEKRNTIEWNHSSTYLNGFTDNLIWNSNGEYKDELDKLRTVLRRIINSNSELANLLKQYDEVVIGNITVIETLYDKQV